MESVSYQASFPGPVGKIDGGLAATVLVVAATQSREFLAEQLGEQLAAYLRGVQAVTSRYISCRPLLLDDLMFGRGDIFAGPSPAKYNRVGGFQLERMTHAGTT